jgi:gas vesicle protein
MSQTNELTAAFALGVVAGGVAALLLAPEKGEVTRKRLKDGAIQLAKRGETLTGEIREATAEAMKVAANTARKQAEALKGAVAEGAKTYREQLEHAHV